MIIVLDTSPVDSSSNHMTKPETFPKDIPGESKTLIGALKRNPELGAKFGGGVGVI